MRINQNNKLPLIFKREKGDVENMDDKLKRIREDYIEGYLNMEYGEICGQDLFLRHLEGEIQDFKQRIEDGEISLVQPQAVVEYLETQLKAYKDLKYYQEHINREEVAKLYD